MTVAKAVFVLNRVRCKREAKDVVVFVREAWKPGGRQKRPKKWC